MMTIINVAFPNRMIARYLQFRAWQLHLLEGHLNENRGSSFDAHISKRLCQFSVMFGTGLFQ